MPKRPSCLFNFHQDTLALSDIEQVKHQPHHKHDQAKSKEHKTDIHTLVLFFNILGKNNHASGKQIACSNVELLK